jgi:hypothetical protein
VNGVLTGGGRTVVLAGGKASLAPFRSGSRITVTAGGYATESFRKR